MNNPRQLNPTELKVGNLYSRANKFTMFDTQGKSDQWVNENQIFMIIDLNHDNKYHMSTIKILVNNIVGCIYVINIFSNFIEINNEQ